MDRVEKNAKDIAELKQIAGKGIASLRKELIESIRKEVASTSKRLNKIESVVLKPKK